MKTGLVVQQVLVNQTWTDPFVRTRQWIMDMRFEDGTSECGMGDGLD